MSRMERLVVVVGGQKETIPLESSTAIQPPRIEHHEIPANVIHEAHVTGSIQTRDGGSAACARATPEATTYQDRDHEVTTRDTNPQNSNTPNNNHATPQHRRRQKQQRQRISALPRRQHESNPYAEFKSRKRRRLLAPSCLDLVTPFRDSQHQPAYSLEVSFQPPFLLSENIRQDLLQLNNSSVAFGCVADLKVGDGCTLDEMHDFSMILDTVSGFASGLESRLELTQGQGDQGTRYSNVEQAIYNFLCKREDDPSDVVSVTEGYMALREEDQLDILLDGLAAEDVQWWASTHRTFAFLRRLLLPILVRDPFGFAGVSSFSFVDALLSIKQFQPIVVEALTVRMLEFKKATRKSRQLARLNDSVLAALNNAVMSGRLESSMLPPFDFLVMIEPHFCGADDDEASEASTETQNDQLTTEHRAKLKQWMRRYQESSWLQDSSIKDFEAKSCDPEVREELVQVRAERGKLIDAYGEKQERLWKGLAPEPLEGYRNVGGDLVITEEDMPLSAFIDKVKFMNKVNATFPRPYYPQTSRPRLQVLAVSDQTLDALKALFFDRDGSLSNSIRSDIDNSLKHGYINFSNALCTAERHDKRWQVPIKHHRQMQYNRTRQRVESLLGGVFDLAHEKLNDLGILIGGTEDQSLHHDVARQVVSWVPSKDGEGASMGAIAGWEVERIDYNEAMASPHAPCSMIMGMGDRHEALLGVQKDQIRRIGNNKCEIIDGESGTTFDMVRENDALVVIRASPGCIFTGDFPHAGVRNFVVNTDEDRLMSKLYARIGAALQEFEDEDRSLQTKAVVDVLCDFPGLNRICRLHVSTEKKQGGMTVPANTIGFSQCKPNLPDPRCTASDAEEEKSDSPTESPTAIGFTGTTASPDYAWPTVTSDSEEERDSDDGVDDDDDRSTPYDDNDNDSDDESYTTDCEEEERNFGAPRATTNALIATYGRWTKQTYAASVSPSPSPPRSPRYPLRDELY